MTIGNGKEADGVHLQANILKSDRDYGIIAMRFAFPFSVLFPDVPKMSHSVCYPIITNKKQKETHHGKLQNFYRNG